MDSEVTESTFSDLGLSDWVLKNLSQIGFKTPTPIQAAVIPRALDGADVIGQAQTGTGKTAAFGLPVLQRLKRESTAIQALILTPTRELSEQVQRELELFVGKQNIAVALAVGGRPIHKQLKTLERLPQIVVGTPGRVIDLINRGVLHLGEVDWVILDEADRMLEIGFRQAVERILRSCSDERQTLLLSATMPKPVEELAQRYMVEPERIDLSVKKIVVDQIEQFYCTVDGNKKFSLLIKLLQQEKPSQAIVFCRTKRGAHDIYTKIKPYLGDVGVIHGDLAQSRRDRVMRQLREGEARLVIATDIVGRGIDISGISHIINFDIPESSDDYVHRVGRAGRLSSSFNGRAFTFVTPEQGPELTKIEVLINNLLTEYQFEGFDGYTQRETKTVADDPDFNPEYSSGDDWDSMFEDL